VLIGLHCEAVLRGKRGWGKQKTCRTECLAEISSLRYGNSRYDGLLRVSRIWPFKRVGLKTYDLYVTARATLVNTGISRLLRMYIVVLRSVLCSVHATWRCILYEYTLVARGGRREQPPTPTLPVAAPANEGHAQNTPRLGHCGLLITP
jgi:hypothetical protein